MKVLKKYAKTICGKPILAYYNRFANAGHGDLAGHEDSDWAREYPIGFFPEDTKITYEKDENGTVYLCADGYIWNVYYSHITELFEKNGGKKGVSSEMLILDSEVIEETNIEEILQYSFTGVTVLGDTDAYGTPIVPAVEGCQGILVTNSVMNEAYQKAKKEFEKILNAVKQGSVETDSFFIEKNEKEELMEKDKKTNSGSPDVVENAEQVVTTKVKVSTDTCTYDDRGCYLGSSSETHKKETTKVVEVPDDQVYAPALNATDGEDSSKEKVNNVTDTQDSPEPAENACREKNATEDSEQDKQDHACKQDHATDGSSKEGNACKSENANGTDNPSKKENACKSKNADEEIPEKEENACKSKNSDVKDTPNTEENACRAKNADTTQSHEKVDNSVVSINEYNSLKKEYDAIILKCQKLEEYKNNRESEDMRNAVEVALNSVSHILNADQIDDWRKESQKYSVSQLDDFRNRLKAFAFDIQGQNGIPHEESIRNSIPKDSEANYEDVWDRISKNYF